MIADYIEKRIPICRSCSIPMTQYGKATPGNGVPPMRYFKCGTCGQKRKTVDKYIPRLSDERKTEGSTGANFK